MAKKKTGGKSPLEKKFLREFLVAGGDLVNAEECFQPVRQLLFATPIGRKWRFDFCWPSLGVAVEIDGGIFVGGGHNRGAVFAKDAEKHRAAVFLGWTILRYTTRDFDADYRLRVRVRDVLGFLIQRKRDIRSGKFSRPIGF